MNKKGKKPEDNQEEEEGQELCPKCGNLMVEEDGEKVCSSCVDELDFFGEEEPDVKVDK